MTSLLRTSWLLVLWLLPALAAMANQAPIARDTTISTRQVQATNFCLASVTDPDGDELIFFAIALPPQQGSLVLLDSTEGCYFFQSSLSFQGTLTLPYVVSDGQLSDTATLTIVVGPRNRRPTAQDQKLQTPFETPLSVQLTGADPDGDSLTFQISVLPSHGTYTLDPETYSLIYTPNPGFSGQDSIGFRASDGDIPSRLSYIRITVLDDDTGLAPFSVTDYVLVNAETNEDIGPLLDGDTLFLSQLPSPLLSVRANTNPDVVGSVVFDLNGSFFNLENVAPYALGQNQGANYFPVKFQTGTPYELTARPYSEAQGQGEAGTSLTVNFILLAVPTPPAGELGTFSLIDADSNEELGLLADGDTLDLGSLPTDQLSLTYNIDPAGVGSVVFELNDAFYNLENNFPYALNQNQGLNFFPAKLEFGLNTVKATPYSAPQGGGTAGSSATISFFYLPGVVDFVLVNADNNQDIGTLQSGDVLLADELPTQNLNIRANTRPAEVGSVAFTQNGMPFSLENVFPYAFGQDLGGDYLPVNFLPGDYVISATAFSEGGAEGEAGRTRTVSFTYVSAVGEGGGLATTPASRVFPNPFAQQLRLQFDELRQAGTLTVRLYDAVGRQVFAHETATPTPTTLLDLPELPRGMYLLRLTGVVTESHRLVRK